MLKANKVSGKSGQSDKDALRNSIGIGGSGLTVVYSDGPRGGEIVILGRPQDFYDGQYLDFCGEYS